MSVLDGKSRGIGYVFNNGYGPGSIPFCHNAEPDNAGRESHGIRAVFELGRIPPNHGEVEIRGIHYLLNILHGNAHGLGLVGNKRIALLLAGDVGRPHFLVEIDDRQHLRNDGALHYGGYAVEHGVGASRGGDRFVDIRIMHGVCLRRKIAQERIGNRVVVEARERQGMFHLVENIGHLVLRHATYRFVHEPQRVDVGYRFAFVGARLLGNVLGMHHERSQTQCNNSGGKQISHDSPFGGVKAAPGAKRTRSGRHGYNIIFANTAQ